MLLCEIDEQEYSPYGHYVPLEFMHCFAEQYSDEYAKAVITMMNAINDHMKTGDDAKL